MGSPITLSPETLVYSDFEDGTDGWRIYDLQYWDSYNQVINGAFYFQNLRNYRGRNPGYIVGGNKWHGDLSAAYGGILSYDLFLKNININPSDDVRLSGNGISIYYDIQQMVSNSWNHFDIPLMSNSGWKIWGTNNDATADELKNVLSDISDFRLMGEYGNYWYGTGQNVGYFDNITMSETINPVNEPRNILLFSSFLIGVTMIRRRKLVSIKM
ncbi:MAG: hypothetical protein HRT38_07370 [Alteromonadaceae bacterium]|nr:hypothetical protein [Alteromonadaceae bacterium]